MYKKRNRKGVTLIELLIVVLILAALSAIAIPRITQSADNARSRADETNLDLINTAIEQYYHENGSWPADISDSTLEDYFPDGVPKKSDGDAFTYNSTSHRAEL